MDPTHNHNRHHKWNPPIVEALLEEASSDPPADNTTKRPLRISRVRLQHIVDGINQQCNTQLTTVDVYGQYHRLERDYHAFTQLIRTDCFFWDRESNVVLATLTRWDTHLQAHPDAVRFRARGCAHYSLMHTMFSTHAVIADEE
ncbi:hypothetical protein CJ030_MR8G023386 [Morella rubra]|uniref:Myb/SANT-like domain-containing protein n=1 Tax=Morella rubra TaxID=262757 RepID=A0A6A1UT46_9ROSI|nr:hypothetical protein CJ030_MR8G023386 [Morella rubra]